MSTACVTEPLRISVTEAMLAASGVSIKKLEPNWTLFGAEVMDGRAPLNKYGGDRSGHPGSCSGVAVATATRKQELRRPGRRIAVEWYIRWPLDTGHCRPGLRGRRPHLRRVNGIDGEEPVNLGRSADRHDVSVGQHGQVQVRSRRGDRGGLLPGGRRLIHIDDVRGGSRRSKVNQIRHSVGSRTS